MADSSWNPPDHTSYAKDTADDFFPVEVHIDKLQVSFFGSKPSNATVDCEFLEKSFKVTCQMKGSDKPYLYEIKELPGPILPNKCKYKCEKGCIKIYLKKAEDDVWSTIVEKRGLEQARD